MNRIVVTGAAGRLGRELTRLKSTAKALTSADLDITDAGAVAATIMRGDVVINCAAYTSVDAAESDSATAFAVNEVGAREVARCCARIGARLIHLSTDYVFDGSARKPYDTHATPAPLGVYGRSKLAGEWAVAAEPADVHIVRTAWVYSVAAPGFMATMLSRAREAAPVRVVDDRFGSPTYAADLAAGLLELVENPTAPRLLHAVGGGTATWYDMACAIYESVGADSGLVQPCAGATYAAPAVRPDYSVLSGRSWVDAGLSALPHWRDALRRAMSAPA